MKDNRINREFLGQGLTFPLRFKHNGALALAQGEEDIQQAIRIILGTVPGERLMRPEFGCRIHELVFAPRNTETESMLAHYVETALERWEPRIEVLQVESSNVDNDEGAAMLLEIKYRIKATYD
ncbi:MAG: GPW/gp25 family protein, partial [Caldilineaceae bacterium]|nr:GPW/gp25 family protein [Caldilineaceae bacterium]